MASSFPHPEIPFMEDPDTFPTAMVKREVTADVLCVWRMKEFEHRYERYERQMKQWYRHEDDWPMFDMSMDYW